MTGGLFRLEKSMTTEVVPFPTPSKRRSSQFRQSDVARAVRGVQDAGLDVARVEVDAFGKIVVICGRATESIRDDSEADGWERRLRNATGWAA
jgi:hypothetical protein